MRGLIIGAEVTFRHGGGVRFGRIIHVPNARRIRVEEISSSLRPKTQHFLRLDEVLAVNGVIVNLNPYGGQR